MKNVLLSTLLLGTIFSFPAHSRLTISTPIYLTTTWEKPHFFHIQKNHNVETISSINIASLQNAGLLTQTAIAQSVLLTETAVALEGGKSPFISNYNNLSVLTKNKHSSATSSGVSEPIKILPLIHSQEGKKSTTNSQNIPQPSLTSHSTYPSELVDSLITKNPHNQNNLFRSKSYPENSHEHLNNMSFAASSKVFSDDKVSQHSQVHDLIGANSSPNNFSEIDLLKTEDIDQSYQLKNRSTTQPIIETEQFKSIIQPAITVDIDATDFKQEQPIETVEVDLTTQPSVVKMVDATNSKQEQYLETVEVDLTTQSSVVGTVEPILLDNSSLQNTLGRGELDLNTNSANTSDSIPLAPPPPPPPLGGTAGVKKKHFPIDPNDLKNAIRGRKNKIVPESSDITNQIKKGHFSLNRVQPLSQKQDSRGVSTALLVNALKSLKSSKSKDGAEQLLPVDQTTPTNLEKRNVFHSSRQTEFEKADKRGIAAKQLVDFRKNLRKINIQAIEKREKPDHTAMARILGHALDESSLNQGEIIKNRANLLSQGLQNVQLKKTPRSAELYKEVVDSPEMIEKKNKLNIFFEQKKAEDELKTEQKNKEVRLASANVYKFEKIDAEQLKNREMQAKKNIGKAPNLKQEPTLLEQIASFKFNKVVKSFDIKPESTTLVAQVNLNEVMTVKNPIDEILVEKIVPATPLPKVVTTPVVEKITVLNEEVSTGMGDMLLQGFAKMNLMKSSEVVDETAYILKSFKKYQTFFNHTSTEFDSLKELIPSASETAVSWLKDEINKAKDYDPDWDDDTKAYSVGKFFELAKDKLQEEVIVPVMIKSEPKKLAGLAKANRAGGDLFSAIRALKKEEPEETPSLVKAVSVNIKDLVAKANKAGGDLLSAIRTGRDAEREAEIIPLVQVVTAIPSTIELEEPANDVSFVRPPPPPPPFEGFGSWKKGLEINSEVIEANVKLPIVETLDRTSRLDNDISEKENFNALLRKNLFSRRQAMDSSDDEDED